MKKMIRGLAVFAAVALLPAFANVIELKAQTPAASAAQGQCTDEAKLPFYADFIKFRTTDTPRAAEAARKYLALCPAEEGPIPTYLKKWIIAYDKEARKIKLNNLFDQAKYAEALPLAKEVLADEPDNLRALMDLGYGGYRLAATTNNQSGNAEAISYGKRAIQAIELGKAPESWAPFKSKDDGLGYLYFSLGFLERSTNPSEALAHFIKAAQFDSDIKKTPQTYLLIAEAYEGEYAKQGAEYQEKFSGKDETQESKLAVANINQTVDRIIDARARSVAVAGTDPNAQTLKAKSLERLTELYKFRNKSDAGLTEIIASVMSKPLPPIPTRITTLPAAAPTTSTAPRTGTTTTAGSTTAPATLVPPVRAATTTTTTTSKTTPKAGETASTKPVVKPKTRNNHRRH